MQCATHAEAPAKAVCTRCDRLLCTECTVERGGRTFCAACAEFLDRREEKRRSGEIELAAAPPPAGAAPPAEPALGAGAEGLYQGPDAPNPSLGADAAGLYQGPATAPAAPAGGAVAAASGAGERQGTFGRGAAFAVVAGVLGALAWYGIVLAFDATKLAIVGSFLGFAVGYAAVAGAGGGGRRLALTSLGITGAAILLGEALITRHHGVVVIGLFDWILYAIGLYEGYSVPAKAG